MVQVKGRTQSTRIYTLLEALDAGQTELDRLSSRHQEFLAAYSRQQWNEAERLLSECRSIGITSPNPATKLFFLESVTIETLCSR